MLSQLILNCIELGKIIDQDGEISNEMLTKAKGMGAYYISRDELTRAAFDLSNDQIALLLKALVFLEKRFKWSGGSVAGVIWVYRVLEMRNPDRTWLDHLTAWILENTSNPYNPFGTRVTRGAVNYSDYLIKDRAHRVKAAINQKVEDQRQAEAAKQREAFANFQSRVAGERYDGALRKQIDLLLSLETLEEQISFVALNSYPAHWYPPSLANSCSLEFLKTLPIKTRKALVFRLLPKRRGPWGKFKKRLRASMGDWDRLSESGWY